MAHRPRVLVIDDGQTYARVVAEELSEFELVAPGGEGAPASLPDGPAALEFLERHPDAADVVLLDLHFDVPDERLLPLDEDSSPRRTKRFQGVAILREVRRRFPGLPVVLLTSREDVSLVDAAGDLAGQSMTYFLGSDDLTSLRIRVNAALADKALGLEESDVLWGGDPAMRAMRRRLTVLARGRMPVILEGETGTGKSYLAERFVHVNSGRSGPFVTADLSAVPVDLAASYLFGAVRGAYTGAVADRKGMFELAHRGTLFIDEIQNIPPDVQKQLLVVLQDGRLRPLGSTVEKEVDVKVIAASNTPLGDAVAKGRFRPDLYMRLSPATRVVVPPLRERPGDLGFLMRRFVDRAAAEPEIREILAQVAAPLGLPRGVSLSLVVGQGKRVPKTGAGVELMLPEAAWNMLAAHAWPGNVRELSMVVYNAVAFTLVAAVDAARAGLALTSPRFQVDPGLIGQLLSGSTGLSANPVAATGSDDVLQVRIEPGATLSAVASSVERQYFLTLFERTQGDFPAMARILLGDPGKGRAVRLRFNQLGLKVRELGRA
ncbi:MAG: sigma 54-interacting transcriptional regulator [Deltaproteobacteria bacterium]|nr:sigma 54-interacting transcriptional regulator [Deltaproteobacteria bacterium]